MKKFLLVLMMGLMVVPLFAHGGKKKKKHKEPQTEVSSVVQPIRRERWVELENGYYVIVSRTTITKEDYLKIKNSNR